MAFAIENFNKVLVLMATGKKVFERSETVPKIKSNYHLNSKLDFSSLAMQQCRIYVYRKCFLYESQCPCAHDFFFTAAAAALAISIDYSAMTTSAIDDDFFCIHCDFFFMSCLRFHFHNWHLLLQIGFGWSQPEANLYMPLLFRQTYRRKMLSGTFRVLWIFMPKMTPFLIKNSSEREKY